MNRLLPLIGMMVAVAALTGAAIGWVGWGQPFWGKRASNQLDATSQNKQGTGTQKLGANQPNRTAQNNQSQKLGANQGTAANQDVTAQAPNTAGNSSTSGTAAAQSDASQTVPALW